VINGEKNAFNGSVQDQNVKPNDSQYSAVCDKQKNLSETFIHLAKKDFNNKVLPEKSSIYL
jgi:hypothetical protein